MSKKTQNMKSSLKSWLMIPTILMIGYLAFMGIYVLKSYTSVSVQARDEPLRTLVPHLAAKKSHVEGSAYVFLALGAQANSMTCSGAIESLVRYSGWDGDVFLLTDRPNCFDKEQIVRDAEMDASRLHITVVDGDFSSGGFDSAQEVRFRKARLMSLTMKTRIFELIPNTDIEVLAFIDCDIIVGVEGCATSFIADGPQFPEYNVKFSRTYYTNPVDGEMLIKYTQEEQMAKGYVFTDVHSGTFVAHRKHSAELMELWRGEMESFQNDGDHNSFMAAYHKLDDKHMKDIADGTVRATDPYQHPMRPGELKYFAEPHSSATMYEKFFEDTKLSINCFNHISKNRCSNYGRDSVQKFVEIFKLNTYKIDRDDKNTYYHPYCTHPMVQPLLYGWFPVKYIPFCPKFEKIG